MTRARVTHAWLAVDPGIATGWALLTDAGRILATSVWGTAELRPSLDELVRWCHRQGIALDAVVEEMPLVGGAGTLGQKLAVVQSDIGYLLETYEVPTVRVPPGEWKPSRVARTTRLPDLWRDEPLTVHQRDAIRMGRYAIARQKEKP